MSSFSRFTDVNNSVWKRVEGTCELNTVLDDVLASYAGRFADKFVAPISEGAFVVRVSDTVLKSVISLIFEGMWSAGLWQDGENSCMSPLIAKCLDGYGALLELTDPTTSLPPALLAQLARPDVVHPHDLPGRKLLAAQDRIQRHGGRLCARSPMGCEKAGTSIQLFLPLAASAIRQR